MSGYIETRPLKSDCPTCDATEVRVRMEPGSRVLFARVRHQLGCPTIEARRTPPERPQEAAA